MNSCEQHSVAIVPPSVGAARVFWSRLGRFVLATMMAGMISLPAAVRTPTPVLKEPGTGLGAADIEAVYLLLGYEVGPGGAIQPVFNPHLLLNDGRIYADLTVPPGDLDVTASLTQEAKRWGRWTRANGKLVARWNEGKPSTWKRYPRAVPAQSGQRLQGVFKSTEGGDNTALGGAASLISVDALVFDESGRFRYGTLSGNEVTTSSRKDSSGTYLLDGFTIELRYDNGSTKRAFFCFFPEGSDRFIFGSSGYVAAAAP